MPLSNCRIKEDTFTVKEDMVVYMKPEIPAIEIRTVINTETGKVLKVDRPKSPFQ